MEFLVSGAGLVYGILTSLLEYAIPFLVAITVLVFVHEMGHYLVARWCGVRVEVFSVGFGSEIWGRTDSRGTRWKLSWIPIGGYVKMFGEMLPPTGDREQEELSPEDARVSFHTKALWRRAAIVFAGPFANFLFAAMLLAVIFATVGERSTPANITAVMEGSAAERAGMKPGDVIRRVAGSEIERFEELARIVRMSAGIPLEIELERDGELVTLTAVPDEVRLEDGPGAPQKIGRLGVSRSGSGATIVRHDPGEAVVRGIAETFRIIGEIFRAIGQMLSGARDASDLGGPLRIAQISGDVWQAGVLSMAAFVATLSINLGLINLFPIPLLDGGHLMFYAIEAVAGRPPGERMREYGYRMGIAMVLGLMVFVTWNDLLQLRIVDFIVGLVT